MKSSTRPAWGATYLTSSTEAAGLLKWEKYHAVFLDMRMPSPDGVELARQIRASRVNASTVIVMITGEEERTLMKRAFEAGVEFFLFKPVARNKLLKLIRVAEGPIERERRRFTRVRMRGKVSLESGNDRLEGTTQNLSLGGALVQSGRAYPLGTRVRVSLELEAGKSAVRSLVVRSVGWIAWGFSSKTLGRRTALACKNTFCR